MQKLVVILLALSVFVSCDDKAEKVDTLFKEVMEIHDEVMPEMSYLRKMAKTLELKVDSIGTDTTTYNAESISAMKAAAAELREANKQMMDWMYDFKQLEPDTPHDEAMQYLGEQKISITKVRESMLDAKEKGEALLVDYD